MRPALGFICMLLCGAAICGQAPGNPQTPVTSLPTQNPTAPPGPVPVNEEPHHRLVLQNDFVHVYNVMVPALDATLVHLHDVPYLYVVLGPADFINAVTGKPEVHQVLQDGETHYSPGHFAHLVRTESGLPFHNVTIELMRPQGTPKNLCKEVLPGGGVNCEAEKSAAAPSVVPEATTGKASRGKKAVKKAETERETPANDVPYFESDEVRVELHKVSSGNDYVDAAPKTNALLVALTDANLDANLGGEHLQFLHGGDVLWMPTGQHRRLVDFLGTHSSFLVITFKDSAGAPQGQ